MTAEERKALNQAAFREANEGIRETQEALAYADAPLPFICECDRPECTQVLPIGTADYERVREKGTQFVVVSGHENGWDPIWAGETGYVVLDKTGIEGIVAEQENPRREH
jgi:hypothetical protein